MRAPSRGWRRAALLAGLSAAALATPARAVLGEDVASIQADQLRFAGMRRQSFTQTQPVHTLTMADGSTIRQYVSPDGRVYAVAWNTHYKPRLDQLLGAQFASYAQAGRQAMQQRPGVLHNAVVSGGDLVVESTAHLNAYVGRAYLRSLVPVGAPLDAIR